MNQQFIIDESTKVLTEVIIIVLGTFGSIALAKVKHYLDGLKKKDELGIVNTITNQVVQFAEAELTGAKGAEKRAFAAKKASAILAGKGISISQDEILAGIEDGVNKLKIRQANLQTVAGSVASDVAKDVVAEAVAPQQPATPVSK